MASRTIGYHCKPVFLYDMERFYAPLINLLDAMQSQGMIRGHWQDHLKVVSSLADLQRELAE